MSQRKPITLKSASASKAWRGLAPKQKRELSKVLEGIARSRFGKKGVRTVVTNGSRRYLPTLADLVDRLTIVQMKMIFIPENAAEYANERADIEHDIDLIMAQKAIVLTATDIHAICMIQLTNHFIWTNESKARQGGPEQDKLLKMTHSINGVRNAAKNQLAVVDGGRKDYKIDCFAEELVADFGNWNVFGVGGK